MSNIVVTKIKFERNLKGFTFNTINHSKLDEVLKLGLDACTFCGLKAEQLSSLSESVIDSLIQTNKLERDFASNLNNKGYASNNDVSVQINGKNHIEIIASARDLFNAYANAKEVDKQLCNKLNFAYSDKYGFLNPDIRRVGSGLRIETLIMLPALTK